MLTVAISGAELTPKNQKMQRDLEHRLNRWFQTTSNGICAEIRKKYKIGMKKARKQTAVLEPETSDAEGDDLQTELLVGGKKIPAWQSDLIRAIALMGWKGINWEELVAIMQPYLQEAGYEGVDVGVGQVQMTDAKRRQQAAEAEAEAYADRRSAELAGMKRNAEGELVPDPDAHWPLTDVMRRDIENSITQAVVEGWTVEQLDAVIDASYALSAERATVIANTEITNAQSGGTYSLWRQSGTVTLVRWVTSDMHDQDDECDDFESQGVVPLGHEFAEGLFAPRAHPFCRCSLEVVDPNEDLPVTL